MRFFFAAQDAQHAEGEGFHLVFAWQHMHRSEEGHTLRHPCLLYTSTATRG